jgi:hypothetical protein
MPLLRYHASMPSSTYERQVLERELAELPEQIAGYQRELDATPTGTPLGASGSCGRSGWIRSGWRRLSSG